MKGVRTKQARGLRIAAALWFCAATAYAQSTSEPATTDGAPRRDVGGAAQAFAEAQTAQLANDFVRAAQLFELADALAPTKEALRSAMRNREAAGHPARAATLALVALERYADDPDTVATANETIARAGSDLARLRVACDLPCMVLLDGQAIAPRPSQRTELFAAPGAHQLDARFDSERTISEQIELVAGELKERELNAPPRVERLAPEAVHPRAAVLAPPQPARAAAAETGGISPWYFASAGVVTIATATAATAIGLDALRKRDAYEAEPTRERYEAGVQSQKWANALWIATAGFAATSVVLLAFTDWDGEQQRTTASISVSPWAANLVVRSSLP